MEIKDKFWTEDISILYRSDRILEFFVTDDQSLSEKLNSITRFSIYSSILLSMYHSKFKYMAIAVCMMILSYIIYYNSSYSEDFDTNPIKDIPAPVKIEKEEDKYFYPTVDDPFGNNNERDPDRLPMADYISYNKNSIAVKQDVDDKFGYNLYTDSNNLFGKENSQRQFYTVPDNGQVPNDPKGDFGKWLYGSMKSIKENPYDFESKINIDLRAYKPLV